MKLRVASILVLGFCLLGLPARAQQTATGTVYQDANANGQLDSGEEGIADVAVSNGRQVVLTDSEGSYSIEVDEQDSRVFVIKPAGYQLPVDELNRPQFYYLHKPDGSPELDFQGVGPTGELPESINFPLIEAESKNEFQALIFGDPQSYTRQEVDYFDRDIVAELHDATSYEFGISLGDLVGDNLDLFQPYSESVAKVGIPWFNVYGNHDMNFDAQSDKLADETFEATFGPATYSFNHGQAHFIILDDVVYPRTDGKSGYIGGLTDQQLDFIENDLKHVPKDHLVVLAFHIPIPEADNGSYRLPDRQRLFNLLKEYPHTLSLSAHTHIQQFNFFDVKEGWSQLKPHIHYNVGTTSGDWWSGEPGERDIPPTLMRDGTPNGYAMLNIDGNSFTIDYKAADYAEDYKMSIWGPKVVPQDSWHGAQLFVNYFLGSNYTQVQYRVKEYDDAWRTMGKAEREDPHVAALRQKWDGSTKLLEGKRPSNPIESTHLWKGGVPNNLPLGEQVIEVRVTDMFGRTFTDEFTYRVVEPK
jgi:hypothetical protein